MFCSSQNNANIDLWHEFEFVGFGVGRGEEAEAEGGGVADDGLGILLLTLHQGLHGTLLLDCFVGLSCLIMLNKSLSWHCGSEVDLGS